VFAYFVPARQPVQLAEVHVVLPLVQLVLLDEVQTSVPHGLLVLLEHHVDFVLRPLERAEDVLHVYDLLVLTVLLRKHFQHLHQLQQAQVQRALRILYRVVAHRRRRTYTAAQRVSDIIGSNVFHTIVIRVVFGFGVG